MTLVGAVVLAAGQSSRMGRPKLVLPWGEKTIITQVLSTIKKSGVVDVIVITGGAQEAVREAITGFDVQTVHNPDFQNDDMVRSLTLGLRSFREEVEAAMIVLGDQPQIKTESITRVIGAYEIEKSGIVIPSYQRRRGHPWLVQRKLWSSIFNLAKNHTLRDFLEENIEQIHYVEVDEPSILKDIDTPADYQREISEQKTEGGLKK